MSSTDGRTGTEESSESDTSFMRVSRASERERIMLWPDRPEESYICLYTEEYLADDNIWNRRSYPCHVPKYRDEKSGTQSTAGEPFSAGAGGSGASGGAQ